MAVWLVTGATGFVGRHVLDALERGDGGTRRGRTQGRSCWAAAVPRDGRDADFVDGRPDGSASDFPR